ncbi:hypothetical protein AGABI2DRAFT_189218 [Agaricus bisporus var. bisporus H97]|uniref:hypothetical protein n=1 Tax=Agaricus bisporus var. bisporus (strain H97 / ATCC MYA-4626 / FGSC 10389) TaxID=936046 RepID=UPI00029F5B2E|nr:hypothetical protein AGABI2DRAFT_189218 [Agaricus bisporus var. bisporus H97]EKV50885.1 hypothetical protein AGABI2DRAFT_189218 [Agaricus bisporus var. bisporus H97]
MFSKLCLLAIVTPLIAALTLEGPTGPVTTSSPITLNWTSDATDPGTFSLSMVNENFHDTFAIANNVQTNAGTITLTLPSIPPNREYTIIAINISNVTDIYATTPPFNVGPAVSTSQSSTSATGSSANPSGTGSTMSSRPPVGGTTTGFGVTVSNTPSGTTTPTDDATSSGANAPSGTNFGNSGNSGMSVRLNSNKGIVASAMLSLIAGAAIVAL